MRHIKTPYFTILYVFTYICIFFICSLLGLSLMPSVVASSPAIFGTISAFLSYFLAALLIRSLFTLPIAIKRFATLIIILQTILTVISIVMRGLEQSVFGIVGTIAMTWIFVFVSFTIVEKYFAKKQQA